jgi:starvation-inducible DNA-binding protein
MEQIMTNQDLSHELMNVLANTYALYLKNQNYHWNVTGPQFKALHELFEEHYTEMADAIDVTAEHIRSIGEKVDGQFSTFQSLSSLGNPDHTLDSTGMIKDLIKSHEQIMEIIQTTLDLADDLDDDVIEDFCIQRLEFHRKAKWFLTSSI